MKSHKRSPRSPLNKGGRTAHSSKLIFCWGGSQFQLATVVLALSFLSFNQQVQACAKHTGTNSTPTALSAPQSIQKENIQTETTPVLPVVHPQETIEQPQPVLLPKKQSRTSSNGKLFVPAITSEVTYPLETK
jgi:hypothetical protein